MSKTIRLCKGLNIRLKGEAERRIEQLPMANRYGVMPADFEGITPKLLVKEGDAVKVGTPLFFSKDMPRLLFTSPVSGKVVEIRRGEKRRILEVVVENDRRQLYEKLPAAKMERDSIKELLLTAGLWPYILQRPYGRIADPDAIPRAIFVSGFDSAPLAPDMDFVLGRRIEELNKGFEALRKLTDGQVVLGLRKRSALSQVEGVTQYRIKGPHPAGNVGVQINRIAPINKGEIVWTVDIQAVAMIGRLLLSGKADFTKTIALTGSEQMNPRYVEVIAGAQIGPLARTASANARIICGNVLSGTTTPHEGYLGFYANQITLIPEGDTPELLGWAMPRLNKFSVSHAYFSWLMPWKRYALDTNLNGGERAFVFTGLYEKYLPMDIYPMYLLKACITDDIDKMEQLGIYEVVPEDFALCEFVDPSKTEMQQVIREGINLMIKELS